MGRCPAHRTSGASFSTRASWRGSAGAGALAARSDTTDERVANTQEQVVICDFCARPDPEWSHVADTFTVDGFITERQWNDDGNWAVCDPCHDLIVDDDREGLLRRSVNYDQNPSLDGAYRRIRGLHRFFWKGYHGQFERMPEEELTAEHRLVAFHQGNGSYQAVCRCGWKGAEGIWDYEQARREFEQHSGGSKWSVQES